MVLKNVSVPHLQVTLGVQLLSLEPRYNPARRCWLLILTGLDFRLCRLAFVKPGKFSLTFRMHACNALECFAGV